MATSQHLSRLAHDAEDVASTLRLFREQYKDSSSVTDITDAVGKLFGVSSALLSLADAQGDSRYRPSLYRIQNDVDLMYRSAKHTVEAAMDMVDRPGDSQWMIWGDLNHRMATVERVDLLDRLNWYQVFGRDLLDLLNGRSTDRLSRLREELHDLLRAQERARSLEQTGYFLESAASTPRPATITWPTPSTPRPTGRPRPRRPGSDFSDTARYGPPPPAPDAPLHSPTLTSSSTHTLNSSQTSSYGAPPKHWAEEVFVGLQDGARSPFRGDYQIDIESFCMGEPQHDVRYILDEEGFLPVARMPFTDTNSVATFYLRPEDRRARILFAETDSRNRETLFCVPLNTLRVIRNRSILQLCRASERDGSLRPWAKLKFIYYERMVLFYSTLVALKRQDWKETPFELLEEPQDMDDEELFGGVIRAGNGMLHALRLFRCHGSGAVRLEARPFEGDMEEVPIWTAFLTKYVNQRDQDFLALESQSVVTMCRPRPEPFVFVNGYRLPLTPDGNHYTLRFDSKQDATEFVVEWNRLCSAARRS